MNRRIRTSRTPSPHLYGVKPTGVLAVGNDQRFIEEISTLLMDKERIELLGGAQSRSEAAERLILLKPDVVVIDVNLDYELGGIDTAFALRRISPSAAFVLVSPFSDPERLSMIPRGLGLEWSYVLSDDGIDGADLAAAISSAAWSIPYIDRRIDRSQLGKLQEQVDRVVEIALSTSEKPKIGNLSSKIGYANWASWKSWNGKLEKFRLPEDDPESGV